MRHRWLRMVVGTPSMTSCRRTLHVLQRFLDGEIDETTARRVTTHLEACRRCGLEAATYREIKDALARRDTHVSAQAVHRLRAFARDLPNREVAGDIG